MCKIKDATLKVKEINEYYKWSYMEHLYEMMPQQPKLTESDINKMEQDYSNSPSATSNILSASVPQSAINITEPTTRRSA